MIFIGLILFLILAQLRRIDKTNPVSEAKNDYLAIELPNDNIKMILKESCYDCHSNETTFPWYSNVAPLSWWLKGHVDNGRKKLNFSDWGTYANNKKSHKIQESIDAVSDKWMPLGSYTMMHPKGKLSKENRALLIEYFKSKSF